ncbi:MAG TPA: XRE family transcriptional regulator [Bacteroides sp.]|nr:XRE family transcriptional regulator [Bacteroides sp.]
MEEKIDISLVKRELDKQAKTKTQLAKFLGITRNTMVTIFKTGICRIDQFQKMAEFLQVSLLDFIAVNGGAGNTVSQRIEILTSHNELLHTRHMEDVMKLKDQNLECLEKLAKLYEEHNKLIKSKP